MLVSRMFVPDHVPMAFFVCRKRGKYPALLRVPGAGIRPYYGDVTTAEKGAITLEIGIHGIPVTMTQDYYDKLFNGALWEYWKMNNDNRDAFITTGSY